MGLDQYLYRKQKGKQWRKVNCIQGWMNRLHMKVNETDEPLGDCEKIELDRNDLNQLLTDIETVLADHSKAEEMLPVEPGFFFGNDEYDEYYFQDLEEVKADLKDELNSDYNCWEYYGWW